MALRDAAKSPTAAIQSLVKELVDQFDQPLDFYRELIQNAIDAGSNRIDVTLERVSGPDGRPRAVIRIEDDGEGMDENVINNYLLVLFKSTKEDDFTKIGKFGIGFVSVFAPQPERVRIYTAKNGQSWRLDFPDYKRYDLYRMPEMREGTLVELIKPLDGPKTKAAGDPYATLVEQSRQTIRRWCKHAETRILFHDRSAGGAPETINEPFILPDGAPALTYSEEGTEIVLGYSQDDKPFYGFYNKGLTLKEGRNAFFPGVQFKVKSRYLEHTLTRDNVMDDDNYRKAMAIVERLVAKELPKRLRAELRDLAVRVSRAAAAPPPETPAGAEPPPPDLGDAAQQWARRMSFLEWTFSGWFGRWRNADWEILPTVSGQPLSIDAAWKAFARRGAFYFDVRATRISRALEEAGCPVLVSGPWLQALQSWWRGKLSPVEASKAFVKPLLFPESKLPAPAKAFLTALRELDAGSGAKYKDILLADLAYPGSCARERIFVVQKEPGAMIAADLRPAASFFGLRKPTALLNAFHPFVQRLMQLHDRRPGLAAFLCLKVLHLYDGDVPPDQRSQYCSIAEKVEAKLLQAALQTEARRRSPA